MSALTISPAVTRDTPRHPSRYWLDANRVPFEPKTAPNAAKRLWFAFRDALHGAAVGWLCACALVVTRESRLGVRFLAVAIALMCMADASYVVARALLRAMRH